MLQQTIFSPQRQAHLFSMGVLTVIAIGTIGLIVACIAAIWLAFQVIMLLFTSIIECCQIIGSEYAGSDSFVKLLILAGLTFLFYRILRHVRRSL